MKLGYSLLELNYPVALAPCSGAWANQCAIRLSIALQQAGVSFSCSWSRSRGRVFGEFSVAVDRACFQIFRKRPIKDRSSERHCLFQGHQRLPRRPGGSHRPLERLWHQDGRVFSRVRGGLVLAVAINTFMGMCTAFLLMSGCLWAGERTECVQKSRTPAPLTEVLPVLCGLDLTPWRFGWRSCSPVLHQSQDGR